MWSTFSEPFFRYNSGMIIWRCLFLACLMIWVSSSVCSIVPDIALQKPFCIFDSINWFSRRKLQILFRIKDEYIFAKTGWSFFGQKFERFILENFLLIKIVNACFQQLGKFHSLQQCDIILCIKVLNIGHLFRIIVLIWSCREGDPLDMSLLIIPVISS